MAELISSLSVTPTHFCFTLPLLNRMIVGHVEYPFAHKDGVVHTPANEVPGQEGHREKQNIFHCHSREGGNPVL